MDIFKTKPAGFRVYGASLTFSVSNIWIVRPIIGQRLQSTRN